MLILKQRVQRNGNASLQKAYLYTKRVHRQVPFFLLTSFARYLLQLIISKCILTCEIVECRYFEY